MRLAAKSSQVGVDGAIVFADDVPARLRFPGGALNLMVEEVRGRSEVRGPDDLLFLFRQVSGEALDAFRKHPGSTIRDFDVGEKIGFGELLLRTTNISTNSWISRNS
jgi:hypothetical protein